MSYFFSLFVSILFFQSFFICSNAWKVGELETLKDMSTSESFAYANVLLSQFEYDYEISNYTFTSITWLGFPKEALEKVIESTQFVSIEKTYLLSVLDESLQYYIHDSKVITQSGWISDTFQFETVLILYDQKFNQSGFIHVSCDSTDKFALLQVKDEVSSLMYHIAVHFEKSLLHQFLLFFLPVLLILLILTFIRQLRIRF